MPRSRLNWFLLPVGFAFAYEAATWAVWAPLNRGTMRSLQSSSFIPFWEGEYSALRPFGFSLR